MQENRINWPLNQSRDYRVSQNMFSNIWRTVAWRSNWFLNLLSFQNTEWGSRNTDTRKNIFRVDSVFIIMLYVVCEGDPFNFLCMCLLYTFEHMCGNGHHYIPFFLDEGTQTKVKSLIMIFHHVWFESEMSQRSFALFKVSLPACGTSVGGVPYWKEGRPGEAYPWNSETLYPSLRHC